jgi:hypothetical protein
MGRAGRIPMKALAQFRIYPKNGIVAKGLAEYRICVDHILLGAGTYSEVIKAAFQYGRRQEEMASGDHAGERYELTAIHVWECVGGKETIICIYEFFPWPATEFFATH